jgi:hypothetical protein
MNRLTIPYATILRSHWNWLLSFVCSICLDLTVAAPDQHLSLLFTELWLVNIQSCGWLICECQGQTIIHRVIFPVLIEHYVPLPLFSIQDAIISLFSVPQLQPQFFPQLVPFPFRHRIVAHCISDVTDGYTATIVYFDYGVRIKAAKISLNVVLVSCRILCSEKKSVIIMRVVIIYYKGNKCMKEKKNICCSTCLNLTDSSPVCLELILLHLSDSSSICT